MMNSSIQLLLLGVCGVSLVLTMPACQVSDGTSMNKLMGMLVQQKPNKHEGMAVCPSHTLVLTDLEVNVQVGSGYNMQTQREECWVDKDLDIRYEQCQMKPCDRCQSKGKAMCVPVTRPIKFRAICKPIKNNDVKRIIKPKPRFAFVSMDDFDGDNIWKNDFDKKNDFDSKNNDYQVPDVKDKKDEGKIRDLTVELPVCCQCQVFKNC